MCDIFRILYCNIYSLTLLLAKTQVPFHCYGWIWFPRPALGPLATANIQAPHRLNSSHDGKLWWISCLDSQTRVRRMNQSSFVISAGCWLSSKLQQRSGYDRRGTAWTRYDSVLYSTVQHTYIQIYSVDSSFNPLHWSFFFSPFTLLLKTWKSWTQNDTLNKLSEEGALSIWFTHSKKTMNNW